MKYVLKIHVECFSELEAGDLEQEFHNALGMAGRYKKDCQIKLDQENTFVVAVEYNDYHKPEHTD